MDETLADVEQSLQERQVPKKRKYRKDKPWDDGSVDKWKIDPFHKEDLTGGHLLEESSFAVLFPSYREHYLKQVWPDMRALLDSEHGVRAELDLVEGSMTVRTTKKTFDPFIILKARDLLKLLARSVPFSQAKKILEDGMFCEVMKTKSLVRSKEKFVKRRQRLVGPNGSTLKAIELLTECYVLVQGQTCCIMGGIKGIKSVRKIVEDCFRNIHPVYHVKELMIKRELANDPDLKDQEWDRFLPKFKKRSVQSRKLKKQKAKRKSKFDSVFPPEQMPRKEDLLMESGEYFWSQEQREETRRTERRKTQIEKSVAKKREKNATLHPKTENLEPAAKRRRKVEKE